MDEDRDEKRADRLDAVRVTVNDAHGQLADWRHVSLLADWSAWLSTAITAESTEDRHGATHAARTAARKAVTMLSELERYELIALGVDPDSGLIIALRNAAAVTAGTCLRDNLPAHFHRTDSRPEVVS